MDDLPNGLSLDDLNISFNLTLLNEPYNATLDNTSDTMFNEAEKEVNYEKALLNYYLMGIGGTSICFIGIICNILSVIVLTRSVMNSSTYSYLAALAVCDTIALFFTVIIFLINGDTTYPQRDGTSSWPTQNAYGYLFPILHPAAVTFQVTSIWLTLAFTVDRYIMICHPFKAENMCSVSRARKVIIAIYLLGILFNIPRFLEYKTKKITVPSMTGDLQTLVYPEYTKIGSDKLFIDLVHSYLYLIFVCGIPFFTLSLLNMFLIYAVHLSRKRGRQINVKEKKRNDTTIMLIGVVIIFLTCQGPALISRMVYAFDFVLATKSLTFHKINEVGNFLIIVNSAVNIVPYYFFGKRFRREFWRLFCKCLFTKQELRKITRSLSFSIDNRRRVSQCSYASGYEMNGFGTRGCELYNNGTIHHRDSNSPLLQHLHKDYRDSIIPTDVTDIGRRTPSPCLSDHRCKHSPQSLKVVWEMDDNKNEKYNVKVQVTEPSSDSNDKGEL